ncbi:MAG: hypothetical protein K2X87_21920 [Gemmataceae bacterium]|nr:hypothetical protein [Gemmataceae bacterium]
MSTWKWYARTLALMMVAAALAGGLAGCGSTGGGGYQGSDGHAGHNH